MQRLTLVELIEEQTAALSAGARETWEGLQMLIEAPARNADTAGEQEALIGRAVRLPSSDRLVVSRLIVMMAALYAADHEEWVGRPGGAVRADGFIRAAKAGARHPRSRSNRAAMIRKLR